MQLEDLYKLAGIQQSNTPAIEPKPVEQEVVEQPMDGRENMKAMIALISPEQLNQLVGDAPVEEEGFANSGDEYAGEPEAYNGTLGSPADLSLRRYLGANGQPVKMENVYADHKVEDITEAWQAYKVEEGELPPGLKAYQEKKKKKDDIDEHHQKDAEGNTIPHDDEVAEQKVAEEPNEANKFIKAKIDAEEDGDDSFTVDGKKYKVKDSADLDRLRALAGTQQVDEGGMKQAEIEVQDWVEKYEDFMGVNGDSLPEGYLQAMLNSGIVSDAFDQDEYIAFNKKNGYEDDGDWQEGDHDKFMMASPNTKGMFDEIRAIQDKYGIDEQEVNDIMGYFEPKEESINDLRKLAGI